MPTYIIILYVLSVIISLPVRLFDEVSNYGTTRLQMIYATVVSLIPVANMVVPIAYLLAAISCRINSSKALGNIYDWLNTPISISKK
jgi:hypothetical protein